MTSSGKSLATQFATVGFFFRINDLNEFHVERAMGIEPTALAWEARVLPLYDARLEALTKDTMVSGRRF